jgi:hypothetical protein
MWAEPDSLVTIAIVFAILAPWKRPYTSSYPGGQENRTHAKLVSLP